MSRENRPKMTMFLLGCDAVRVDSLVDTRPHEIGKKCSTYGSDEKYVQNYGRK
jgi:hypothetical protein